MLSTCLPPSTTPIRISLTAHSLRCSRWCQQPLWRHWLLPAQPRAIPTRFYSNLDYPIHGPFSNQGYIASHSRAALTAERAVSLARLLHTPHIVYPHDQSLSHTFRRQYQTGANLFSSGASTFDHIAGDSHCLSRN